MIEFNFFLILAIGLMTAFNVVMLKKNMTEFYNRIYHLETRLNYHEVALAHADIVPMPWELEELENIERELDIKKEGNVVYINREEVE
jgi:hypothetical protein